MSYFLYSIRAFWSSQSSLSFPVLIHHFDCFSTCAVLLEATNQPGTVALVCSSYKLPFCTSADSIITALFVMLGRTSQCVCATDWNELFWLITPISLKIPLSWCGLIQRVQELCLSFAVHVFCLSNCNLQSPSSQQKNCSLS